jgi:hypothetical protein
VRRYLPLGFRLTVYLSPQFLQCDGRFYHASPALLRGRKNQTQHGPFAPETLLSFFTTTGHSAILFAFGPFPVSTVIGPTSLLEFLPGATGLLQFPSSPCYRVAATTPPVWTIASASLRSSMLSSPTFERLDHRSSNLNEACSAFTHVATRSLAHQPCADLVGRLQHVDYSSCCYSARRLLAFTAAGLPSTNVRVTLWITTAIHLDTPKSGLDPFQIGAC